MGQVSVLPYRILPNDYYYHYLLFYYYFDEEEDHDHVHDADADADDDDDDDDGDDHDHDHYQDYDYDLDDNDDDYWSSLGFKAQSRNVFFQSSSLSMWLSRLWLHPIFVISYPTSIGFCQLAMPPKM